MPLLHVDQVPTDSDLVRRLVADQFPQWGALPVTRVDSFGTDHDIYRLGERLAVRLPCIGWAAGQPAHDAHWLPRLVGRLPVPVSEPVALGEPAHGYPFSWAVHTWLPGDRATPGTVTPRELANLVLALRRLDPTGAPASPRGGSLRLRDEACRRAVRACGDLLDERATLALWDDALAAGPPVREVWVHGDLLPGNLLAEDGRLCGLIDFGCAGLADPAVDLFPAWHVVDADGREEFRALLGVDDATWRRGRGWTINQAVMALPYYRETNPGIVGQSLAALAELGCT